MIVEIIKANERMPKQGEFYFARNYPYDSEKVTLIWQVDPITYEKLDKQYWECSEDNPLINEYRYNIRVLNK